MIIATPINIGNTENIRLNSTLKSKVWTKWRCVQVTYYGSGILEGVEQTTALLWYEGACRWMEWGKRRGEMWGERNSAPNGWNEQISVFVFLKAGTCGPTSCLASCISICCSSLSFYFPCKYPKQLEHDEANTFQFSNQKIFFIWRMVLGWDSQKLTQAVQAWAYVHHIIPVKRWMKSETG